MNPLKTLNSFFEATGVAVTRAGHWARSDFLKSFHSVLERGPSARLFRSRSFFQSFRSRSVSLQIVPIFLRTRTMCSFFFRNDWIVLNNSVRSHERTIILQERRPALV